MSTTVSKETRIGTRLGGYAQVAVMTWAAFATSGALSICLWVLVAFCILGLAVSNV